MISRVAPFVRLAIEPSITEFTEFTNLSTVAGFYFEIRTADFELAESRFDIYFIPTLLSFNF